MPKVCGKMLELRFDWSLASHLVSQMILSMILAIMNFIIFASADKLKKKKVGVASIQELI